GGGGGVGGRGGAWGGMGGHCGAPFAVRGAIEQRDGFAGPLRTLGGMGGHFGAPHLHRNRRFARSSGGSRPRATSFASTYLLYAVRISALPTDLSPQRTNF